ncbi:hypothetical protein N7468_008034 [Penicillium chermesinum]|uniref:Apple domain-containing protein n=1 Tax=Penicillium chermesinum TaxID=63820 RepID=A0A9W9NNZ6_9EURO|nr:uncharacterized protein N7468_008034 [Penicillium chermesinum]KAJ5223492.1 hypothetical protein N7468_008034 [Penicillium chermesinum]
MTCRTELATTSVKSVPTTTLTTTIHGKHTVVVYSTARDTVIYTPVSTETATDYTTTTLTSTADAVTDTFSTTSTVFDTATLTVTADPTTITFVSTTSTVSTRTYTIAAAGGFTPIVDTLTAPTLLKRALLEEEDTCSPWIDDYKYPKAVECHEKLIIKPTTTSVITATPFTATATTSTTTVTVTSTVTTSSIVLPSDVSTTLSFSTTSTITETTSVPGETSAATITATVLGTVSATSVYAACATPNIASAPLGAEFGSNAGQRISQMVLSNIPGQQLRVGNSASAYDCCASCMADAACAMGWTSEEGTSSKYCYFMETRLCSQSETFAHAYLSSTSPVGFQAFNGNCGKVIL